VRRTSRLVLLLGIFLAALTFVVVLFISRPGGGGPGAVPSASAVTQLPTVVAALDIPLGTIVTAEMVTSRTLAVNAREAGALGDVSQAINKTTRTAILAGQQGHTGDFQNRAVPLTVPVGERAFAIQVNQLTGVGNLVDVGDNLDLIISLRGDAFPVVQVLDDGSVTVVSGINPLSIKLPLLLQDVQVIGVINPPPPPAPTTAQGQAPASQAPQLGELQNKLLILSVTPAQAEVLLFARTAGTLDVILRSPTDAGQTVETTGVILKTLVDLYGILPPEIVQVPIPTPLEQN
jgi:Flp pilus assembly protein CpaB